MQTVFKPDINKRKIILKTIACKHRQWRGRMFCMYMLFIMAVLIIIGTAILLICNPTTLTGILVFMAAGGCFAVIPFVIGLSVKNTAKYKCAFPYSSYANGILSKPEWLRDGESGIEPCNEFLFICAFAEDNFLDEFVDWKQKNLSK